MRVIEQFIKGKKSPETCEDRIVINDAFVAVIDGVTAKTDFTYNGKTPGWLAAEAAAEVLSSAPAKCSCQQIIQQINDRFSKLYEKIHFTGDIRQTGLQAAAVICSAYHREIWIIGDCQAMIDRVLYENPKKSDQICAAFRGLVCTLSPSLDADGEGEDLGRDLILPWIMKATVFANNADSPYGYAVLNGSDIPEELIKKISLGPNEREIILASDGYPILKGTISDSEQALADLLLHDPQCCDIYCSTKGTVKGNSSFDDRAYVRFVLPKQQEM